jgi:hypothetical protein
MKFELANQGNDNVDNTDDGNNNAETLENDVTILEKKAENLKSKIQEAIQIAEESNETADIEIVKKLMEDYKEVIYKLRPDMVLGNSSEGDVDSNSENQNETTESTTSPEQALEIMGELQFIGPEDIQKTFGFTPENIPVIQFSTEELERAKELGQQLILYVDKDENNNPLTTREMKKRLPEKTQSGKTFFYNDWYDDDEELNDTTPSKGWRLTTPEVIEKSTSKNYLEQTETLIKYLENEVFKDTDMPEKFQQAITEFNTNKDEISDLMGSDWKEAAKKLANLEINKLTREQSSEIIYRLAINEKKFKTENLENTWSWSNSVGSGGSLVHVGDFDSRGLFVGRNDPRDGSGIVGVCFSRSD